MKAGIIAVFIDKQAIATSAVPVISIIRAIFNIFPFPFLIKRTISLKLCVCENYTLAVSITGAILSFL
jgi:hypothetical protein